MTRRSRHVVALTTVLAASCTLVDPLGGLTGGASPGSDATTCEGSCGEVDAMSDGQPDSFSPMPEAAVDAGHEAARDATGEAAVDAGSVYAAAVLADTPLAYWRLGDAPTSGSCHDATGNGNDATVVGGVSLGVPGALLNDSDTAVHFDGSTAVLQAGSKFDFAGTVPLTIELWAKPDMLNAGYGHLEGKMLYNDAGQPYDGIYMYVHTGTTLGFERWGNGSIDLALSSTSVAVGSWWHIVGTYSSGVASLYVNGALADTGPTAVSVTANTVSFQMGDLFQGSLDEVALYGSALSAPRILAHYQASGR
ncbi:MAG TPA: LamG domain-containing protein [Polyangiaceae bacterium]